MDERFTSFYVDYNIEDTTAKNDATFSTTDTQQQTTDISRLIYPNTDLSLPYFTFEHNFNVLDGSLTEMPVDPDNQYIPTDNTFNQNSILFVESTDGTIIVDSTSTVQIEHSPAVYTKSISLAAGKWYISGCPTGGSNTSYSLQVNNGQYIDYGNGLEITLSSASSIQLSIVVAADYFAENVIFTPVISRSLGPYITTKVPYFNNTLSDEEGQYETNPKVVIDFTTEHASLAFSMQFIDDHPLEAKISFYNLSNEVVVIYTATITSNYVLIPQDVFGYSKIVIEFTKTLPNHYIKFKNFFFGIVLTWGELNVQEASVVQEIDRISKNLSIDTLSFKIIDVKSELNLGNLQGIHRYFQKNQYMLPYEIIQDMKDGLPVGEPRKIKLGKYYLRTFSESSNLGKMTAQSYISLMDDNMFYEGEIYNGKLAGEVIEQIFTVMGTTNYEIDNETYNQPLYGTITPKSCRKALQEVLFACNSIINAHDVNSIIIKKTSHVKRPDIPKNKKFSTSVTKNDYTYGVEIKYTTYSKEEELREIAKDTYSAGIYELQFNEPYTGITITGATLLDTSTYHIKFRVSESTEVVIKGYAYLKVQNTVNALQSKLLAGEEQKFTTYSTNLCNKDTAQQLAAKLLDYLNLNLTVKMKWLADNNDMNDFHVVENPNEDFNDYLGVFIKRTLDLTGGFIDTATMAGKSIEDDYYKYTREDPEPELYSGEGGDI